MAVWLASGFVTGDLPWPALTYYSLKHKRNHNLTPNLFSLLAYQLNRLTARSSYHSKRHEASWLYYTFDAQ